jgi:uncharacterized YceG family protein
MPVNGPSKYPLSVYPRKKKGASARAFARPVQAVVLVCVIGATGCFLLPQLITTQVRFEQAQPLATATVANTPATVTPELVNSVAVATFPVSVDPATKSIVDNPKADQIFKSTTSLTASADTVSNIISWFASLLDNTSLYQSLAAADGHLIRIGPGYRKEQVVAELTQALGWNAKQQQEFLADASAQTGLTDGMFAPGSYVVDNSMTPSNVAAIMSLQFDKTILLHYSTTTASQVPLGEALTVASLIEREAKGPEDMRQISGIIWNRLFDNMNLQIDATLQYAKGEKDGQWWGPVVPKDKYIVSAYNTYMNNGLPPGPIASPSLAAVLAALNPVSTKCLFYFHDQYGNFHCSDTYAEHVALLKKYYGQGK